MEKMNFRDAFRDRDLTTGTAEDEYLDAVFDTAALEREVSELTGFDEWHGGGSGGAAGASSVGAADQQPAFRGFTASREVLERIEEVRELQQRVFHSHLKVEVNLNNFVQAQSADVSKAEASAKVCRSFRNEFDGKKNIIDDVSELLSELAEKVDGVNKLVAGDVLGAGEGGRSETKKQRARGGVREVDSSTTTNDEYSTRGANSKPRRRRSGTSRTSR